MSNVNNGQLGIVGPSCIINPAGQGIPSNVYVAEDGVTTYVAEDGITFYVAES